MLLQSHRCSRRNFRHFVLLSFIPFPVLIAKLSAIPVHHSVISSLGLLLSPERAPFSLIWTWIHTAACLHGRVHRSEERKRSSLFQPQHHLLLFFLLPWATRLQPTGWRFSPKASVITGQRTEDRLWTSPLFITSSSSSFDVYPGTGLTTLSWTWKHDVLYLWGLYHFFGHFPSARRGASSLW